MRNNRASHPIVPSDLDTLPELVCNLAFAIISGVMLQGNELDAISDLRSLDLGFLHFHLHIFKQPALPECV